MKQLQTCAWRQTMLQSLDPASLFRFAARRSMVAVVVGLSAFFAVGQGLGADLTKDSLRGEEERSVASFVKSKCLSCHNAVVPSGGHDFGTLPWDPQSLQNRERWARVHDRIALREMPPETVSLTDEERGAFLALLGGALHREDLSEIAAQGRRSLRRLNRSEFEWNLRDLLELPHLGVRSRLPEDRTVHGFNKSGDALDMSHVQLSAYLDATKSALLQAAAPAAAPLASTRYFALATQMFETAQTYGGPEAMFYARDSVMLPITPDELEAIRRADSHDESVELALFRSAGWPYYGYPDGFLAELPGEYRVRFEARAVAQVRDFRLRPSPGPVPMTFRARKPSGPDVSGDVRATGGLIDVQPRAAVFETTVRLAAGETFEYSLLGLPVPQPNVRNIAPTYYDFPPMPEGGHPGVAFRWIEITGPVSSSRWPPASHRVLFGDLPIRSRAAKVAEHGLQVEVIPRDPARDAKRLVERFAQQAAHAPVPDAVLKVFQDLVLEKLDAGEAFGDAVLAGYQAFLCSVHFLYLPEPHDPSDHYALASRLSHFLWNSRPDKELQDAARAGNLRSAAVLRKQTERLIESPRFARVVDNFLDYWLDLKDLHRDDPDIRLYPEYRFSDYLVDSMERETKAAFTELIQENLPITFLIDSDVIYVNDRLAAHYGLPPVVGSAIRKTSVPPSSPYGGFLTQAAVSKVTSNGTTTSPVIRGAWVMDRLLGDPPPPPPPSVPAVEPDIRGAKTMREILALHSRSPSCSGCHARFDPIGMALENFDVMGSWRQYYRGLEEGILVTGIDRAGHDYSYRVAEPVDPSGKLLDGREFRDVHQLKSLLIQNPRQLARNLLERFAVYAIGTPVRFSDRREIDEILDRCAPSGYRVRDLVRGLILSRIFLGPAGTDKEERS